MLPPAASVTPSNFWMKTRARKCSTSSPTATAPLTPSPARRISAWSNTRPASGAAFIRCWKIPSSRNNSAASRGSRRCWKKFCTETQPDCVVSDLSDLRPRHQKDFRRPRTSLQVHHRRHRFHHHQLRVVPRAERLFLRGQRRLRRCLDQGRRLGEKHPDARLSRQPDFRRQPLTRFPSPLATNRAASFTSSTPARKRPAKPLTACSTLKTSISPSPPVATPSCAPSSSNAPAISATA